MVSWRCILAATRSRFCKKGMVSSQILTGEYLGLVISILDLERGNLDLT